MMLLGGLLARRRGCELCGSPDVCGYGLRNAATGVVMRPRVCIPCAARVWPA